MSMYFVSCVVTRLARASCASTSALDSSALKAPVSFVQCTLPSNASTSPSVPGGPATLICATGASTWLSISSSTLELTFASDTTAVSTTTRSAPRGSSLRDTMMRYRPDTEAFASMS
jgi:hypothetical protein